MVYFQSDSVKDVEREFHEAVDDYLASEKGLPAILGRQPHAVQSELGQTVTQFHFRLPPRHCRI